MLTRAATDPYTDIVARCAIVSGLAEMGMPAVVDSLVAAMVENGDLEPGHAGAAATAVLRREVMTPTAMPGGAAFPHARLTHTPRLRAAIGVSPGGLDLGAPDGTPTRVVVLVLAPPSENGPYLRFMAALARCLGRPGAIANLAGTKDAGILRELLLS